MAALVREAGLAVVRELMSNYPTGSSMPAAGRAAGAGGGGDHCPSSATATSNSEGTGSDSASSGDGSLTLAGTEKKQPPVCISARHFEAALQKVRPSVALHDRQRCEQHERIVTLVMQSLSYSLFSNVQLSVCWVGMKEFIRT